MSRNNMVPTETQAKDLWDKYQLPEKKRIHSQLVCDTALFLAQKIQTLNSDLIIDTSLLMVACLLHDIDKNIPRLPGEMHPQTGVRILLQEDLKEIADVIRYHSVQYIEDEQTAPHSWVEKLLYLSDKMVKQEIITIDKRFELWLAEADLPEDQKIMLRRVYPKVKLLEGEIFSQIGIQPSDVSQLVPSSQGGQ